MCRMWRGIVTVKILSSSSCAREHRKEQRSSWICIQETTTISLKHSAFSFLLWRKFTNTISTENLELNILSKGNLLLCLYLNSCPPISYPHVVSVFSPMLTIHLLTFYSNFSWSCRNWLRFCFKLEYMATFMKKIWVLQMICFVDVLNN